jgi:hypothetical protein
VTKNSLLDAEKEYMAGLLEALKVTPLSSDFSQEFEQITRGS